MAVAFLWKMEYLGYFKSKKKIEPPIFVLSEKSRSHISFYMGEGKKRNRYAMQTKSQWNVRCFRRWRHLSGLFFFLIRVFFFNVSLFLFSDFEFFNFLFRFRRRVPWNTVCQLKQICLWGVLDVGRLQLFLSLSLSLSSISLSVSLSDTVRWGSTVSRRTPDLGTARDCICGHPTRRQNISS